MEIPLAQYRPISRYKPKVGDFIVWHGWLFSHWYGVITSAPLDTNIIYVVYAGMPSLLFTISPSDINNNLKQIDLHKIRSSKGSYCIFQNNIWYL